MAVKRNTAKSKNPYRNYCTVYTGNKTGDEEKALPQFTGVGAGLLT